MFPGAVRQGAIGFEANIHWKDGKEPAKPPGELDGEELVEWKSENPHEPELLLSTLTISLLEEKDTESEHYGLTETEDRPGPEELLEMLSSPLLEDRWV